MGEGKIALNILTGMPREKIHIGRPRRICEKHIKLDPKEIVVNMRNWIDCPRGVDYS